MLATECLVGRGVPDGCTPSWARGDLVPQGPEVQHGFAINVGDQLDATQNSYDCQAHRCSASPPCLLEAELEYKKTVSDVLLIHGWHCSRRVSQHWLRCQNRLRNPALHRPKQLPHVGLGATSTRTPSGTLSSSASSGQPTSFSVCQSRLHKLVSTCSK